MHAFSISSARFKREAHTLANDNGNDLPHFFGVLENIRKHSSLKFSPLYSLQGDSMGFAYARYFPEKRLNL